MESKKKTAIESLSAVKLLTKGFSYYFYFSSFFFLFFSQSKILISFYDRYLLGFYWIDPNEGIPNDAIKVHCDEYTLSSCLYPYNKAEVHCYFVCSLV